MLQAALAAEQAAIYGYGVVGSHLSGTGLGAATADWTAHQEAADRLMAELRARGGSPGAGRRGLPASAPCGHGPAGHRARRACWRNG